MTSRRDDEDAADRLGITAASRWARRLAANAEALGWAWRTAPAPIKFAVTAGLLKLTWLIGGHEFTQLVTSTLTALPR